MRILSKCTLVLVFLFLFYLQGSSQTAFGAWEQRVLSVESIPSFLFTPTTKSFQKNNQYSDFFHNPELQASARPACFVPAFSANDLPFFCKIEYKIDRKSAMNFRFRVQSLEVLERY